jgi:hypothetical protein
MHSGQRARDQPVGLGALKVLWIGIKEKVFLELGAGLGFGRRPATLRAVLDHSPKVQGHAHQLPLVLDLFQSAKPEASKTLADLRIPKPGSMVIFLNR